MWIIFAFSGPIFWALSTHIDKYLVEKYFKDEDTAVSMVFTACIGLIMLPFIWYFVPGTLSIPFGGMLVMIASGILYMSAMLFYLRAIQSSEASVVAPLFQTSILFTFALGYFVLGERLSLINSIGVMLIILGAISLSLNEKFRFHTTKLKTFFLMLICTFILALSTIIFKFFAVHEQFWSTAFWTYVGEAIFGVGILLIPKYFKQFVSLLKNNTGPLLAINASNELINLGGGLGVRFASLFAPVVIVSAISSTTTLFVFLFGVILTIFIPKFARENLSRANLIQKGIVALIVAIGVLLTQM